jgi:oligosaccharide repeat unit polymerase
MRRGGVWWLNPAVAFAGPTLVAAWFAYNTSPASYLYLWRTPKYFTRSSFFLLLGAVVVFVCGCLFGFARRWDTQPARDWTVTAPWQLIRLLFRISFVLTILAYAVWFAVGIKNGLNLQVILDIIHGNSDRIYNVRAQYMPTIPGLTTGTQFGLAAIVLAVPLGVAKGWRTVRWQCGIIILLSLIRALLNSERLAFLEIMAPFLVSAIWLSPVRNRRLRLLIQSGPVAGVALLYLFFAVSEYFRSWSDLRSNFRAAEGSDFWSFIALRLAGYYATALNNGALLCKAANPLSLDLPLGSARFVYHFPVLKDALPFLAASNSIADERYAALLSAGANPEFSNPSGIFMPFVDFGAAGALLYWLLCGMVCGYLYREFRLRTVTGIFLYPAVYVGVIEASRILYWGDARFFPGIFLLVVGVLFLFRDNLHPRIVVPST